MNFKNVFLKAFFLVSILFVYSIIITSCEKDVAIEKYPDFSEVTKEASLLKSKLKAQLPIIKSLISTNESLSKSTNANFKDKNKKLSELLSELSSESLDMLGSYGVNYQDIDQYVDSSSDPRIAIIGMVFIALQEKGISNNNIRLKSMSIEEGKFPYGQVMDCLSRTFLGVKASDIGFGLANKLTITTTLHIAGRVALRTVGLAGAALAIADFGDCMGWYEIW